MEDAPNHSLAEPSVGTPQARFEAPKAPRLSCTTCRKRKVKCDRKGPNCRNCEKYGEICVYPLVRKKVVRGSAYKDIAQRLEKMERLVTDFGLGPSPKALFLESDETPRQDVSQVTETQLLPKRRTITMQSPVEESDFAWVVPEAGQQNNNNPKNRHIVSITSYPLDVPDGPCSIFSPQGVRWVNLLVGDDSFGLAIPTLKTCQALSRCSLDVNFRHPLPSHSILVQLVNEYLQTINLAFMFFQDEAILTSLQSYIDGNPISDIGWHASINIILAHEFRKNNSMRSTRDSEIYLRNMLGYLPSIMLRPASPLGIGAMLAASTYFLLGSENHAAVTILASALQLMLMAKYPLNKRTPDCTPADLLHRQRLFWYGYVFDHDLALRIGKPPIVSEGLVVGLPEERPLDGIDMIYFGDGASLNFLREQMILAILSSKIYSKLYADTASGNSSEQIYAIIDQLDAELQQWKDNIPELLRPQNPLHESDQRYLMHLSSLHSTYFHLTIAIHSSVFTASTGHTAHDVDARIIPSVALCVAAARAAISLLNYHDNDHPFSIYLLNHVAWGVDILFINILQNKTTTRAQGDLKLLERIVRFFEKHDPNFSTAPAYHISRLMYQTALHAIQTASSAPNMSTSANASVNGADTNLVMNTFEASSSNAPTQLFGQDMDWLNSASGNRPFLNDEWMMPLGFQPEYWQDPWTADAWGPDISDLSMSGNQMEAWNYPLQNTNN